jgi:hypothetical protein
MDFLEGLLGVVSLGFLGGIFWGDYLGDFRQARSQARGGLFGLKASLSVLGGQRAALGLLGAFTGKFERGYLGQGFGLPDPRPRPPNFAFSIFRL